MITCFISAPFPRYLDAMAARTELDRAGIRSTARWLDQAAALKGHDALTPKVAAKAIEENDTDLRAADFCLALAWKREGCEQWGELARALEWGIPVLFVPHDMGLPLMAFRRGCFVCSTLAVAVTRMLEWVP